MKEILLKLRIRRDFLVNFIKLGGTKTDDTSYGEGYDNAVQNEIDFLNTLLENKN